MKLDGTLAEESEQLIPKLVEVGQSIGGTVGNISDTIGRSEFVQGVAGSAEDASQIVGLSQSAAQV